MNNKWRVSIKSGVDVFLDELYIHKRGRDGKEEIITDFSKGIVETFEEGIVPNKCTAQLKTSDMREIVSAFVEYAQSQGFKNSEETFVKGKLEATEKHLGDMRTLLKLKD